jgi:hypothetical protein
MNSKNVHNNINLESEKFKFLGKKIKRFKNVIKPNNIGTKKPPKLSNSTLFQIKKIIQNKKFQLEKISVNTDIKNISTLLIHNDNPTFKLPELSLKEQYQDLLDRKELILPPKYRLLFKKQNYLDDILCNPVTSIKNFDNDSNNNISHSFTEIQNYFLKKINLNFDNKDFQQILYICPFYYIYQSINRISKGIEIKYIDIPKDYIQRMNKKYTPRTNFTLMQTPKLYEPISGEINKAVMEKRRKLFKKILINITLEQHQKFLKENNLEIFDPIKAKTWHHNFDMKNVEDIGVYHLVENNIKEYKKLLII